MFIAVWFASLHVVPIYSDIVSLSQFEMISAGQISWRTRIMERYLELENVSLYDCAKECMTRGRCKSFNFSPVLKYCELCYVEKDSGNMFLETNLMTRFIQSDVSSWNKVGRIFSFQLYLKNAMLSTTIKEVCGMSRICF